MATTNNNLVTANLAAVNAVIALQTDGALSPPVGSVGIKVTGNWTGTLVFEFTIDGANWDSVFATPVNAVGGPNVTSTSANGVWSISIFGYQQVRVRASAFTAGTAVVTMDGTASALPVQPLAAITQLGSNQGGPPLASGISIATGAAGSNTTAGSDPSRNFQGQGFAQVQIQLTKTGDTQLVFIDNPWVFGLDLGNTILLSGGVNGAAVEEVIVSTNNNPNATPGATVVLLQSPVVFGGTNFGTFDNFAINGPINNGATVMGTPTEILMLYDAKASDPKRPLRPLNQAVGNPGMAGVVTQADFMGSNDDSLSRQYQEAILTELRILNFMVAQLKDEGKMEVPSNLTEPRITLSGN